MQFGLGTIYLLIILAKIVGWIEMGWFWVITSFIWLPVLAFAAIAAVLLVGAGLVVGIAALLDR